MVWGICGQHLFKSIFKYFYWNKKLNWLSGTMNKKIIKICPAVFIMDVD